MGELGSWLVRAREARGLTLEDAERDTRISRRYLQALEAEQFEVIPAPVYARGFLRSYSQYLGLDAAEMLGLFPREDDDPAPVIGSGAQQSRAPSNAAPISGKSASRPAWRTAPAGTRAAQQREREREQPMPRRPDIRRPGDQPQAPASREATARQPRRDVQQEEPVRRAQPRPAPQADRAEEFVIGSTPMAPAGGGGGPAAREPTIGVDIGVPVAARRIKQDPQAQARGMMMVVVAGVVIAGIIVLALVISKLGGEAKAPDGTPTGAANQAATTQGAGASASTQSGVPITPGQVPNVIGFQVDRARLALTEAGYTVKETPDRSTVAKGEVIDQSPAGGIARPAGSEVTIVVSQGPQ